MNSNLRERSFLAELDMIELGSWLPEFEKQVISWLQMLQITPLGGKVIVTVHLSINIDDKYHSLFQKRVINVTRILIVF